MNKYSDIDSYINNFPKEIQKVLQSIRKIIIANAKEATEKISYGIPTFVLKKNLVHFAAYENHIGFYPGPSAITKFANKLKKYKTSKGAIQFPLDESVPYDLITKMVKFRVKENLTK